MLVVPEHFAHLFERFAGYVLGWKFFQQGASQVVLSGLTPDVNLPDNAAGIELPQRLHLLFQVLLIRKVLNYPFEFLLSVEVSVLLQEQTHHA